MSSTDVLLVMPGVHQWGLGSFSFGEGLTGLDDAAVNVFHYPHIDGCVWKMRLRKEERVEVTTSAIEKLIRESGIQTRLVELVQSAGNN